MQWSLYGRAILSANSHLWYAILFLDPFRIFSCTNLCFYSSQTLASQLTISKISTYFTIVIGRKMKERAEEQEYQEAIRSGKEVHEASPIEKVRVYCSYNNFLRVLISFLFVRTSQENRLEHYDPSIDILQDYAQIVIQYGYVTLFVSACPLVSLRFTNSSFILFIGLIAFTALSFLVSIGATSCLHKQLGRDSI